MFFSGWAIICLPFLTYHLIKYGDPLEALTPQSSFALNGLTQALGEYSFERWWIDYNLEITGLGIVASLVGAVVLFFRDKSQLVSVMVIGTPFVIIHALILDFGTIRYQIPFVALSIVLISISLPKINQTDSRDYNKIRTLLGTFGITVLLFVSMIHIATLEEEKERNDKFIELSKQTTDVSTSMSHVNYKLNSIRKNIKDISEEIKELEGSNPDKKAEFLKLETLVNEKKEVKETNFNSKKDRDVLNAATSLINYNYTTTTTTATTITITLYLATKALPTICLIISLVPVVVVVVVIVGVYILCSVCNSKYHHHHYHHHYHHYYHHHY